MKYTAVFAALAAVVSAIPAPVVPRQLPPGPFSLFIQAPNTVLDNRYLKLDNFWHFGATPNLEIYGDQKNPSRWELKSGVLSYTPGTSEEDCELFGCPPVPVTAGFNATLGPPAYVNMKMKLMLFIPKKKDSTPIPAGEYTEWKEFSFDRNGFLLLGGRSAWYSCQVNDESTGDSKRTLWFADGVGHDNCHPIYLRKAA
ncbi:hypothetical protein ABW19_dt0204448 [Dactylella cylindrospora]|nr:hypothetical protein ABW19_dt0204448 [Dactylella cylindrospora]